MCHSQLGGLRAKTRGWLIVASHPAVRRSPPLSGRLEHDGTKIIGIDGNHRAGIYTAIVVSLIFQRGERREWTS